MTQRIGLVAGVGLLTGVVLAAQAQTRVVHVSVSGAGGSAVAGLTAADFAVKEGGKTCEIVKVEPASMPMHVALLVDDNGTGLFRAGIAAFVQHLQGKGEFAISTVTGQTMRLIDYTANMDTLSAAIARLNARPGSPDGGQLLEGIYEAARELEKKEARRPVVIAFTVGGAEHSTRDGKQVLEQLQKSGAALFVIEVTGSTLRQRDAPANPAELLESSMHLGEVLGDGSKQSGGRLVSIVASTGLIPGLQQIADDLGRQYAITYALPAGAKPSGRLSVSMTRKGVTLLAPTKVPQR